MSRQARMRRRRRNASTGPVFLILAITMAVVGIGVASVVGYVVSIAASAPPLTRLKQIDPGETSVVYAADGSKLGYIESDVIRTPIAGYTIPRVVKDATVAIEDERFYKHRGVDAEGVVRAAIKNLESGRTVEGGSTLTMQLVRTLYISKERTFKRKVHEAKLAEELENVHPGRDGKEWILNKYINSVPYGTQGGQTAVGIQAASRTFFDKPASELQLHEAALLAGLPQAPSQYNPFKSPDAALRRRNQVLDKMAELRMITATEAAEAKAEPLGVERSRFYSTRRESFFFDYVRKVLIRRYGIEKVRRGGLRIHTTIDLNMQKRARAAIAGVLNFPGAPKSAVVTIDPRNGHILAMASSAKYAESEFNLASQGKRQPGSTFKIMGLMAALDRGVSPEGTTYTSKPLKFNDPKYGLIDVKTYDGSYGGSMDLVTATLKSDNTVYQQLALDIGPDAVKEAARKMGITSKLEGYPGEVLGGLGYCCSPLEMANAYATIASGGLRNRPIAVTKVVFPDGHTERLDQRKRVRAFEDGVTAKVTDILERNITGGTGREAQIGCPAGGKTGTTDNHTDAWFVGFTPNLTTSVWVGFPKSRIEMYPPTTPISVAGGTYPAQIWGAYMKQVKRGCPDFKPPKTPFQASPFFGRYASTGAPGPSYPNDDYGGTEAYENGGNAVDGGGPQDRPGGGQGQKGQTTDGGYDPDLYETPPQEAPDTGAPPGQDGTPPGQAQGPTGGAPTP
ncbi:MAG TPA: transglycosylase domain-containing protein [Solirubrobacteraceae bacterium]|jgi:penicillin-binding protein 1A|nr:transglycosylase domain-containing protein [Solirubrobacteraceae bacterium]